MIVWRLLEVRLFSKILKMNDDDKSNEILLLIFSLLYTVTVLNNISIIVTYSIIDYIISVYYEQKVRATHFMYAH